MIDGAKEIGWQKERRGGWCERVRGTEPIPRFEAGNTGDSSKLLEGFNSVQLCLPLNSLMLIDYCIHYFLTAGDLYCSRTKFQG